MLGISADFLVFLVFFAIVLLFYIRAPENISFLEVFAGKIGKPIRLGQFLSVFHRFRDVFRQLRLQDCATKSAKLFVAQGCNALLVSGCNALSLSG